MISIVFSWDIFVCTSANAEVELCSPDSEVPWCIVAVGCRVLASSRATTRTVSVLNVWVFSHALETTRIVVFERESSVFPRHALEAAEAFREFMTWGSDVKLEAMESEQTGLAFLSLSRLITCSWILWLNSRMSIYVLARRHVTPFPWKMPSLNWIMKCLYQKNECLILTFYISDTLFSYFDIVQLLWHNLYC